MTKHGLKLCIFTNWAAEEPTLSDKHDTNLLFVVDRDGGKISNVHLTTTSRHQTYLVLYVVFAGAEQITYHLVVDLQERHRELVLKKKTSIQHSQMHCTSDVRQTMLC